MMAAGENTVRIDSEELQDDILALESDPTYAKTIKNALVRLDSDNLPDYIPAKNKILIDEGDTVTDTYEGFEDVALSGFEPTKEPIYVEPLAGLPDDVLAQVRKIWIPRHLSNAHPDQHPDSIKRSVHEIHNLVEMISKGLLSLFGIKEPVKGYEHFCNQMSLSLYDCTGDALAGGELGRWMMHGMTILSVATVVKGAWGQLPSQQAKQDLVDAVDQAAADAVQDDSQKSVVIVRGGEV